MTQALLEGEELSEVECTDFASEEELSALLSSGHPVYMIDFPEDRRTGFDSVPDPCKISELYKVLCNLFAGAFDPNIIIC